MGIPNSWSHWNHLHPETRLVDLIPGINFAPTDQLLGVPPIFSLERIRMSCHSKGNWLVVWSPLKNMSSSVGMIIPNRWKNKKCSKPPTRWIFRGTGASVSQHQSEHHNGWGSQSQPLISPESQCLLDKTPMKEKSFMDFHISTFLIANLRFPENKMMVYVSFNAIPTVKPKN